jgi:hypothetical protein
MVALQLPIGDVPGSKLNRKVVYSDRIVRGFYSDVPDIQVDTTTTHHRLLLHSSLFTILR